MKNLLSIAGSDCSGGAGIQADLKTFSAHGVFGMSVITAVTAQNTQGVFAVTDLSPDMIGKQMDAIFEDIPVDGVKVGMVSQIDTIDRIAEKLKQYAPPNVVIDPVMISKSGYDLLQPKAKEALIKKLLPLASIITPNIPEAEEITGLHIENIKDMEKAARLIHEMGPGNVLVKGGHLKLEATDVLFDGRQMKLLEGKRIETKNTHGTGCTLSSAIAANLGLGCSMEEAVLYAKEYITMAIKHALSIGKGVGPTNHFHTLYERAGLLDDEPFYK